MNVLGNLLLSPDGRISSGEFMRGGFILILVGTALSLVNLISTDLGQVLGLLSYALIYPWVVIWIKRLHDGGKSGWMVLAYILLYSILSGIGFMVVIISFGDGSFMETVMLMAENKITETEFEAKMLDWMKIIIIPANIASILTSVLTLYIGDKTIPTDTGSNQYGLGYDIFD